MDPLGVAVRFGLYLDLMVAFGLGAFGLLAPRGTAEAMPLRAVLLASGIAGIIVSTIGLFALAASMAGVSILEVDRETVSMLVTETATGTAWIVRTIAVAGVVAVTLSGGQLKPARLVAAAVAGGIALATLAWTGHGAMDEGGIGWLHLLADIAHLLAAGVWIGALLGLVLLVTRRRALIDEIHLTLTHRALHGFSTTGGVIVATIVVSGLVNSWLLVGWAGLPLLPSTLYGQLLLAKLALFLGMLVFAAANRSKLTPSLERAVPGGDYGAAILALRKSLAAETVCAIAILALVAWLGTLEPLAPMSG